MEIIDYIYLGVMPLGYLSSILDTRRMIQARSAKSRSVLAYVIALGLVSLTLGRAISIRDFLLSLNAGILLFLNGIQLALIWTWRRD